MKCYLQETHFKYNDIDKFKVKRWKKMYYANINQGKSGMAILILDKVDFRITNYQSQKGTLYNDKRVSPPRRLSTPKCECTRYKVAKFMKQKAGTNERKNRKIHNYSWKPQHPSLNN